MTKHARELIEGASEDTTSKESKHFSNKIVIASVAAIVLFTGAIFFIELMNIVEHTSVQPPTELIVSWFAFWTVEIVMLASIKKSKIKNKYHVEGDSDES